MCLPNEQKFNNIVANNSPQAVLNGFKIRYLFSIQLD